MKISSRVFSGRTRDEPDRAGPSGPQQHHSLAVAQCHERLPVEDRKVEILDLGSACGETLAFYSGLSCKIYFADFYVDWKSQAVEADEGIEGFAAACERVLPLESSVRFDLIQSWDLFNYLSLEEIAALTEYLRRFSSDRAPLVSLIWNKSRIPAQPNRYAIIDMETVEYRPSARSERPGPRYKEPVLLRAMPSYRAGRSFLLRHGIQEYIFQPRVALQPGEGGPWGG